MRLPWLQIDADGQTRARMLARLLGVPEPQGLGIALALWTWALEMAEDGDFSGTVNGDEVLLAAAVSWPIERAKELVSQLQRVGFVATTPALRVRGLERYRRTWEKNQRRRKQLISGGTVPVTGANPAPTRAVPAPKTETETDTNDRGEKPEALKPPKKPSAAQDFFAWLSATRANVKRLEPQEAPAASRLNKQFGAALLEVGRPELEGRYFAFLDDSVPGAKDPPWPWEVFAASWSWRKAKAAPVSRIRTLAPGEDPYADQLS